MAEKTFRSRILLTASNAAAGAFRGVATGADKAVSSLKKVAGAGAAAGVALTAAFGAQSFARTKQFTSSLSDLQAITGASTQAMGFLTDASKEFGATTTFSASQAAEAFKLVASAKPDLLENSAALKQVTGEALTLAEASGTTLPEAALALGESLNQFGADADQANRFINVLAAGAQKGASEIPDVSDALRNAGVAAKSAGLTFEETNAAIQTLATVGIKGSDAGTKLRSILVKLTSQANDDFNPAVVGINQALDNLADAELNAVEMKELFGERSGFVAEALIRERQKVDDLEIALTGTNTATEQAAIKNDNLEGDLKRLDSAFEALSLEVGEKWLPIARAVIQIATDIINEFAFLTEETDDTSFSMEQLESTMRTLASTGVFVKAVFKAVGEALGGIAAAVVQTFQGNFSEARDIIKELSFEIEEIGSQAGQTMFEINSGEVKERVRKKYEEAVVEPIKVASGQMAVEVQSQIQTAGEAAAEAQAERDAITMQQKLERLRQSFLTEEEMIREDFDNKLLILIEALEMREITKAYFDEQYLQLEKQFREKLGKLQQKSLTDAEKFEQMNMKGRIKTTFGMLQTMTAGVAGHNKTMFKINKVAAIGNAIINTSQAITEMLKLPFPLNFAMAAVAAAAGAVEIAAIKSAKFGGGTTPSFSATPSVGGTPVGVPGQEFGVGAIAGAAEVKPSQTVTINIDGLPEGGMMSTDATRQLIESIDEQLGDGVSLTNNQGGGG